MPRGSCWWQQPTLMDSSTPVFSRVTAAVRSVALQSWQTKAMDKQVGMRRRVQFVRRE
jgi:hypothetical protein